MARAQARFLTWNIASTPGLAGKSAQAPEAWDREENLSAIEQELLRWNADVVALQGCPSANGLQLLRGRYRMVGAASAHAGFVHLYVRAGMTCDRVPLRSLPAVAGRLVVGVYVLHVLAVHLQHGSGPTAAHSRKVQLQGALRPCSGDGVLVLGDLNMREAAECEALASQHRLREAHYGSNSWEPSRSRYHELADGESHAPGVKFDRVFAEGSVAAEVYMVGGAGSLSMALASLCLTTQASWRSSTCMSLTGWVSAPAVRGGRC